MAEADIPLKLDRLVAGQDRVLARLEEQGETIAVLIAGMVTMTETPGRMQEIERDEAAAVRGALIQQPLHGAHVVAPLSARTR